MKTQFMLDNIIFFLAINPQICVAYESPAVDDQSIY